MRSISRSARVFPAILGRASPWRRSARRLLRWPGLHGRLRNWRLFSSPDGCRGDAPAQDLHRLAAPLESDAIDFLLDLDNARYV